MNEVQSQLTSVASAPPGGNDEDSSKSSALVPLRSEVSKYLKGSNAELVKGALAKFGTTKQQVRCDTGINEISTDTDPEAKRRRYRSWFGIRPESVAACGSYFCPWSRARTL